MVLVLFLSCLPSSLSFPSLLLQNSIISGKKIENSETTFLEKKYEKDQGNKKQDTLLSIALNGKRG